MTPPISHSNFAGVVEGPIIECPKCGAEIKLTESLAAPMMESMKKQFTEKLASEKEAIAKLEAERAKNAVADELKKREHALSEMSEILASRTKKLEEAQKAQTELMKLRADYEDKLRENELNIQKQVAEKLDETRRKARREAEEELTQRVAEKELQITSMQKTIEELKRKSEQGSQQLQGEAQELRLEDMLRQRFIYDAITPVAKGDRGGDVLQRVINNGRDCGAILWESKRTKNWSSAWTTKLREDMIEAKADIAVLATQAMPQDIKNFGFLDGVCVTSFENAEPVALLLRRTLVEISNARMASEGFATKTELLYQYLTGPRFRQRIEAIVESFTTMKEDLDKERRAISKQWEKREKQIEVLMLATTGMYGDLQGIAGKSIQEIEGMDLKALE